MKPMSYRSSLAVVFGKSPENKIMDDEDYIKAPKFQNSIKKYLAKCENPLNNKAIAKLLLITEEEVEKLYQESIVFLRKEMCSDGSTGIKKRNQGQP